MGPVTSDSPYAFVSYSSADRARVFGITGVLEAQGIPLWLDRRSISGGRRWTTEIVRGVEDAAVLVVMCSPASVASRNVQQEVQLAWESERRILPVIVEQVELPAELRYALAGQQWVEVRERPEEEWLPELLGALRNLGVHEQELQQAGPAVEAAPPAEGLMSEKRLHNLPAPRSTFVGRSGELAELERALQDHRLVTLTGPGGVGKSRLALELGWRALGDYPDGVWLVSLESATDPGHVPQLVASAVGVRDVAARPLEQRLVERFSRQKCLLVLDNCERMLDPCAGLVSALTAGSPGLRILNTSRELLGTVGEKVLPLGPLDVPAPSASPSPATVGRSESVQLFLDRAKAVVPDFALGTRNAAAVADICRTLDGIPLAIELAAARMRTLAPGELLSRLGDAFGVLRGSDRTALPRQRTLEAAIDWSYDSLSDHEQTLWRRLAVFAEGFSLAAAERVCGFEPLHDCDVLDLLTSLVDKSLAITIRGASGTRYRLLRTLRQYAEGKLRESGEGTDLRSRHAAWCLDYGSLEYGAFLAAGGDAVVREERANLRAALEYLVSAGRGYEALEVPTGVRMWYLLSQSYPSEGRRLLEAILASGPEDRTVGRARALYLLGQLRLHELRVEEAHSLSVEALEIAREVQDRTCIAWSMVSLGAVAMMARRYDEAEALALEALDHFGRDNPEVVGGLNVLLYTYMVCGDYQRLRSLLDEKLIPPGDLFTETCHLQGRALLALQEGRPDEAERLAVSILSLGAPVLYQAIGAHVTRAAAMIARDELAQGLSVLRQALAMMCVDSDWSCLDLTLAWLAAGYSRQSEVRRAATLSAGAEPFAQPWVQDLLKQTQDHLKAVMEPTEFESCWARGKAMSFEQLIAYALEEPEQAGVQY